MSGNQSILQYRAVLHHGEVITLSSSLRPHQVEKGASLVAQLVKNLPAMWETWV